MQVQEVLEFPLGFVYIVCLNANFILRLMSYPKLSHDVYANVIKIQPNLTSEICPGPSMPGGDTQPVSLYCPDATLEWELYLTLKCFRSSGVSETLAGLVVPGRWWEARG